MAAIVPVTGLGAPGPAGPAEGVMAALKLSRPDDPLSVEALEREIAVFEVLCRAPGEPPCPRLFDVTTAPSPGMVMEWCPLDLERWWADRHTLPEAMAEMFEALAAVCRRVREYAVVSEMELGRRVVHADIKPRNILLSETGRWLLTDFGAAKSRSVDEPGWEATRMIIGTENYIAPETLFNARKPHPAAMDTWSIGCTLYALLRMRSLLRGGGRMPANGTHGHHFRTHRAALVNDLQLRRPTLFADRELDASAFMSPDRLPEKDRAAIADALTGLYANPNLEARLVVDVTNLLDRALQVDPARRYTDPLEMAGDLEALASRARELAVRADGGPTGSRGSAPTVWPPAREAAPGRKAERRRSYGWLLGGGVVAVGALVLLLVVGVGAIYWATRPLPARVGDEPTARADGDGGGAVEPSPAETLAARPVPATAAAAPGGEIAAPPPAPPAAPPAPERPVAARPAPAAARAAAGGGGTAAAPPPEEAAPTPEETAPPADPLADGSLDLAASAPKGSGVVVVIGAEAYLKGKKGKRAPGTLPAGTYELFVRVDGSFVSQGPTEVIEGETTTWRCGFGTCREME